MLPTETTQAEPAQDTSSSDISDDIFATFSYNPFPSEEGPAGADGLDSTPAPAPAEPTPTTAEVPQSDSTQQPTDGGDTAQPVVAKSEADLEKEKLLQEKQLLQQAVDAYKAAAEAKAPAAPASPTEPAQPDDEPSYAFQLPAPLLSLLDSEDPAERHQAIGVVMTGVARNVHKTVTEQYRKELETFASRLPQVINQVVSSTRKVEEIRKDFYGKYTDLDTPQLHPIVQQTATLVMQELKTSEYSPKVAETTAKRIYAMLGRPLPGQQPAAQPQVPPTFTGGGARPAAPSAANSVGDDIFNTLAPF